MSPDVSFFLTLTAVWTSTLTGCPQHGTFAPESSALESLECRNDYRTHIQCSWRPDPQIPLALIHMDPDDHRVSPCVQTPKPSQERVCCRYNTSLFAIGFDDVFFFHTPHSSGTSKTFRLTTFEDADPDWSLDQLDDAPRPSRLTSDPFRLHEQDRSLTDLYVALMEVEINHEVVKDQKGGAIHTKSTPKNMEGSENKTKVLFEGPNLTSEYALPGPSILHCELNGGKNLSCSWDLRTDLARYIIYTLSYRTHSTALAEWCCVEKVEVINEGGFLRTVGVFSILEPGELQVRLTPTPVTKLIRAYQHIRPACPTGLSAERRGGDWILNWSLAEYRTVPLTTELQYWSTLTPEDVKSIFLSDGEMLFAISERSLKGSSEYQAQVRCNVSSTRRSGWRYTGYPSEWTDTVYWTTRPEPLAPNLVAFLLYFLIGTLASAVSIVVFIVLVVLQRRLREWDVSLPSPVHSKVSEVSQHPQMDLCTELKDPEISNAQIVDVHPQLSSFDSENTLTPDRNTHCREIECVRDVLCVDDPCLLSLCSSGNVMVIDGKFQLNLHDPVLPCSEGYLPNPATSVSTTYNAWQEDCSLNVETDDGYMNCPEPDLNRSTNPHLLHKQDLNRNAFRPPSPGRILVVYYSANIEGH